MIYAISKRGEREVLLEFRNWAEHADYIDNGGNAYVITDEWARRWVLDGKEHETGLPGVDTELTMKISDHERIWLQNADDARATGDRLWCQDKVWPECDEQQEPTEYIRADLYHAKDAELERMRREVEEAKEFRAILEGHLAAAVDDYNDALKALRQITSVKSEVSNERFRFFALATADAALAAAKAEETRT